MKNAGERDGLAVGLRGGAFEGQVTGGDMKKIYRLALWATVTCGLVGCSSESARPRPLPSAADPWGTSAPGAVATDAGTGTGVGRPAPVVPPPADPFDPAAACGAATVATERVPGRLLLVFDRSISMREDVNGDPPDLEPSKWSLCERAVRKLMRAPKIRVGDLHFGLLLFPTGEGERECAVALGPGVPHVPVGPLSSTQAEIEARLEAGPKGGVTPIVAALAAGYRHLGTLPENGEKGLILVTDGAENCDRGLRQTMVERAERERDEQGHLTFVVGLGRSSDFLSSLAKAGGTAKNATCEAACEPPIFSTARPNCCHYDVESGNFAREFEAALTEIAGRFVDSCVFRLPRGEDPSRFDPNLVNVGVTFEGESRRVLKQGSNPDEDSWNYSTPEKDAIVIQGPVCEALKTSPADVEIVLGCPTVLI